MQRGLDGRALALYGASGDAGAVIRKELERAGALIHALGRDAGPDEFRGGLYAALVLAGNGNPERPDPRVVQLVREFMASDKPVAAYGAAVETIVEAGGATGRTLAIDPARKAVVEGAGATAASGPVHVDDGLVTAQESADPAQFARTVVVVFSDRLDERALDEMSEMSFPASDPPALSPVSLGPKGSPEARD